MNYFRLALMVGALVFGGSGAGFTQSGTTDVKINDGPITIEADRLDIDENAGLAIFRGKVWVVEGNFNMATEEMIAEYGEGGPSDLNILRANRRVVINIGESLATGDRAVYDAHTEILVVSGHATYKTGDNTLNGSELTVNFLDGTSNMVGGKSSDDGGRVTGVFSRKTE